MGEEERATATRCCSSSRSSQPQRRKSMRAADRKRKRSAGDHNRYDRGGKWEEDGDANCLHRTLSAFFLSIETSRSGFASEVLITDLVRWETTSAGREGRGGYWERIMGSRCEGTRVTRRPEEGGNLGKADVQRRKSVKDAKGRRERRGVSRAVGEATEAAKDASVTQHTRDLQSVRRVRSVQKSERRCRYGSIDVTEGGCASLEQTGSKRGTRPPVSWSPFLNFRVEVAHSPSRF